MTILKATWNPLRTLSGASRVPNLARTRAITPAEIAVLALAGFVAAGAEAWIHLGLKIPGHAILRAVLPMMLGLAIVPRRMSGTIMGGFAGLSALAINQFPGEGIRIASCISMMLVGPAIDFAMTGAEHSKWLYARFILAGVLANVFALGVKVIASVTGFVPMNKPLSAYLPTALPSFIVCGALAGLLSGIVFFRNGGDSGGEPSP